MKTKLILSLLVISTIVFFACKKANEVKEVSTSPRSEESLNDVSVVKEARANMKSVVPENAFNDLDWDNAVVGKQHGEGKIAIIRSKRNTKDSLVYFTVGNIRMYQWAGEVHTLFNK